MHNHSGGLEYASTQILEYASEISHLSLQVKGIKETEMYLGWMEGTGESFHHNNQDFFQAKI